MKIKTVKKLNLPELINHVWENDIRRKSFESKFGVEVRFIENQAVIMNHFVGRDDTFTVTVEEELTEDRIHKMIYGIYRPKSGEAPFLSNLPRMSIREALERTMSRYELEKAYVLVDNEITLIWTKEHGIPESGALEADEG